MTKAKESVLFIMQIVGAAVTMLGLLGTGFWWFAGFYYESSLNSALINKVVSKHEVELNKVVNDNNEDHKKIFSALLEIKYELKSMNTMLKKDVVYKDNKQQLLGDL